MPNSRLFRWAGPLAFAPLFALASAAGPPVVAHAQPAASREAVQTRVIAWPGGDRLYVAINADVRYVQGPGAKVVITGPAADIDDITADRGAIHHERARWGLWWWRWWDWRPSRLVRIVVTAPHISAAGVSASGHLDLGRLVQDRLDVGVSGSGVLDASGQFRSLSAGVSGSGAVRLNQVSAGDMSAWISGSGYIKAAGGANSLHLAISGSGGADLGGFLAQDVEAHLTGAGWATLSPKRSADIASVGAGSVRLLTEPARLITHRTGAGVIVHPNGVS